MNYGSSSKDGKLPIRWKTGIINGSIVSMPFYPDVVWKLLEHFSDFYHNIHLIVMQFRWAGVENSSVIKTNNKTSVIYIMTNCALEVVFLDKAVQHLLNICEIVLIYRAIRSGKGLAWWFSCYQTGSGWPTDDILCAI